MASDKQHHLIKSIITEISQSDRDLAVALWSTAREADALGKLTNGRGGGASTMIDELFAIRRTLSTVVLSTSLPEGRYAIKGQDGSIDLYQVDRPTTGTYAGNIYVKLLVGAPGSFNEVRQSTPNAKSILARIEELGAEASAKLYGAVTRTCGVCSADLSNNRSLASNVGETCATKHGWYYATKAEGEAWAAANLEGVA